MTNTASFLARPSPPQVWAHDLKDLPHLVVHEPGLPKLLSQHHQPSPLFGVLGGFDLGRQAVQFRLQLRPSQLGILLGTAPKPDRLRPLWVAVPEGVGRALLPLPPPDLD